MVDKLFKNIFSTIDNSVGREVEKSPARVVEKNLTQTLKQQADTSECIIHKQKRKFFCEECVLELCDGCR